MVNIPLTELFLGLIRKCMAVLELSPTYRTTSLKSPAKASQPKGKTQHCFSKPACKNLCDTAKNEPYLLLFYFPCCF